MRAHVLIVTMFHLTDVSVIDLCSVKTEEILAHDGNYWQRHEEATS